MRLYRLHLYHEAEGSFGFQWFSNKATAKAAAREWAVTTCEGEEAAKPEVDVFEIGSCPTRADVIELLNDVASHPNNG